MNIPCESPAPLVNSQYRLLGGLDTPGAVTASVAEQDYLSATSRGYQDRGRLLRPLDMNDISEKSHYDQLSSLTATNLTRERNGHARVYTSPGIQGGLGKAVYGFAGVAGKVWEYCRTSAFQGFFAGGGRGFEMQNYLEEAQYGDGSGEPSFWQDVNGEKEKVAQSAWLDSANSICEIDDMMTSNPVPGRFPEEDYISEYMSMDHNNPSTISPSSQQRPTKRSKAIDSAIQSQPAEDEDRMKGSWMLISSHSQRRDSSQSPTRSPSRSRAPYSSSNRSPSRLSPHRQQYHTMNASAASYASPSYRKRPHLPSSRAYTSPYSGTVGGVVGGASLASARSPACGTPSPVLLTPTRHSRQKFHQSRKSIQEDNNTYFSDHPTLPNPSDPDIHNATTKTNDIPVVGGNEDPTNTTSPYREEIQRHAARLRRREAAEEEMLKGWNKQLKAMIREGKEALGTRVEVDVFDDG